MYSRVTLPAVVLPSVAGRDKKHSASIGRLASTASWHDPYDRAADVVRTLQRPVERPVQHRGQQGVEFGGGFGLQLP